MRKKALLFYLLIPFLLTAQEDNSTIGKSAPDFKLKNIEGSYVQLSSELGDGPVLLSFWATWCKPCVEELAEFSGIYNQYRDKGFKMFAISTDNEKTVAKVKSFVRSRGYNFPVLLDTNSEVARMYYARAIPFSVLINKEGKIIYSHLGYMKGDELNVKSKLDELLSIR
ncbi:MAG: thiol-disulfide oxidoreductase ResA [Ignavibacteriaceae bacterium]